MIPAIPAQRKFKQNFKKRFNDLVKYIIKERELAREKVQGKGQELVAPSEFSDILNYSTNRLDKKTKEEKCIAVRTHGLSDISTATAEMNAVARMNTRCKDPAYHFILSWAEHEQPSPEDIFDAAEHALKALGLAEHQYVLAVHVNTDNIHCHIAVNRIHPVTFKSRNIEWAKKTLHMAARQSEIKHGWTHDNGIYIVEIDGHGKKHIVLNPDLVGAAKSAPHAHRELGSEEILPTWHDPDSLDSWLKTKVSRSLKQALPDLTGWPALHAWLSNYDITLTDSGGGGMRLHATSPETGEVLDVAASKGLRMLKRADLEKQWGPFANSIPVPCIVPDLSHLTPNQLAKGVEHVITNTLDHGRPPEHIIRAEQYRQILAAQGSRGMHELPAGGLDGAGQDGPVPLPNTLPSGLGVGQSWQDQDLRRTGASEASGRSQSQRSLNRDDSKRAERKEQRAAARADLRQRFSQYKRFVRGGDTEHFTRAKDIQAERSQALKQIREQSRAAKSAMPKGVSPAVRLIASVEIDAESLRRKLLAEAVFQDKARALRATRMPPLSWRAWLNEQSNLGDQAALSALRGIVYQAQRDAKAKGDKDDAEEIAADAADTAEQQYKKVMARLLEEEKRELAIRSANSSMVRPYEADALLARYAGIQWHVTGNGNVEYSEKGGGHLFTDRGNRVTFDRARVSDDDIRLALAHAQQKFGQQLTLTGDDAAFTQRMAKLADDMGMTVLNPELQLVIKNHSTARKLQLQLQIVEAVTIVPASVPAVKIQTPAIKPAKTPESLPQDRAQVPIQQTEKAAAAMDPVTEIQVPAIPAAPTSQDRLRAIVLSIDPRATFVYPDPVVSQHFYIGPVAATLDEAGAGDTGAGFAQHTGRSVYALHAFSAPKQHNDAVVEVRYRDGQAVATIPSTGKGKGIAG